MVTKQIDPLHKKVLNVSVPNTMASKYIQKNKNKKQNKMTEFGISTIVMGNLNVTLQRERMKR